LLEKRLSALPIHVSQSCFKKVMFLAATAKPLLNAWFDGRNGIRLGKNLIQRKRLL
jgi:hypothetical protein